MPEAGLQWTRMWQLFHDAHALPARERGAFLDDAAGGDAELRAEVEDLLTNIDAEPDFLSALPTSVGISSTVAEELVGDDIGPYRITRLIGEGGMGLVYEAEQQAPIRRRVAIKLIRPGMDTEHLLARFNAERQALASMQHRNIAQVYDAGVTESGRPYFVMELVEGVALDEYCNLRRLSLQARLRLFLASCDAIQHAHQRGILHRDLKPSNILVTEDGDSISVKIIDFGIAKGRSGQITPDAADTTVYGIMIGTPEFTAPELAKSMGADADTASDVYSLGVVLYKLLCDRLPFRRAGTASGNSAPDPAVTREAVSPSQKLTLDDTDISGVAQRRSASPSRLVKSIRGELDWIVGKAIAAERERRYPTVDALASDVRRHLRGEAVAAGPPSNVYRMRKFVRRNKLAVTFTAALATAIVLGSITAAVGWMRALEAEREATLAASRAQAVAGFLTDMLEASGPIVARGRDTTLLMELAESAARDLEQRESTHWFVETEVCRALGTLFMQLGDYDEADAHLSRALTLARQGFGEDAPETADLWYLTAERANLTGDFETAEANFRTAVTLNEAGLAVESGQALFGDFHTESHAGLAEILIRYERLDEALAHAERGLALSRAHATDSLNENLNMVARVHLYMHDYESARRFYEESMAVARQRNPQDWQLGMTLGHYGVLLRRLGEYDASVEAFRESLGIFESVVGPAHERTAAALNSLAVTLSDAGRMSEAVPVYERALATQTKALGEQHASVADTHFNVGVNYRRLGEHDLSLEHFARSVAGYRRHFPPDHSYILETEVIVGQVLSEAGDHEAAERRMREFLKRHDGSAPTASRWVLEGRVALAEALIAQRRHAEAELLLAGGLENLTEFNVSDADGFRSSALKKLLAIAEIRADDAAASRYRAALAALPATESTD